LGSKVTQAAEKPTVLADRGYFKGEEILECERSGINALVPKPQTSNNQAKDSSTNGTSAISLPMTNTSARPVSERSGVLQRLKME
jgi:hypothetical protein